MKDAGTYALVIFCREEFNLQVGKLGTFEILYGFYIYAGSALNGLEKRLKRHMRLEKKLHWHIDYLLQHARIVQIWYSESEERLECTWNGIAATLPGATPFIPGFGSSDCHCRTHLTRFLTIPSFAGFKKELMKRGLPQPQCLKV
jgi:Uri superfamily endonuclease